MSTAEGSYYYVNAAGVLSRSSRDRAEAKPDVAVARVLRARLTGDLGAPNDGAGRVSVNRTHRRLLR